MICALLTKRKKINLFRLLNKLIILTKVFKIYKKKNVSHLGFESIYPNQAHFDAILTKCGIFAGCEHLSRYMVATDEVP